MSCECFACVFERVRNQQERDIAFRTIERRSELGAVANIYIGCRRALMAHGRGETRQRYKTVIERQRRFSLLWRHTAYLLTRLASCATAKRTRHPQNMRIRFLYYIYCFSLSLSLSRVWESIGDVPCGYSLKRKLRVFGMFRSVCLVQKLHEKTFFSLWWREYLASAATIKLGMPYFFHLLCFDIRI